MIKVLSFGPIFIRYNESTNLIPGQFSTDHLCPLLVRICNSNIVLSSFFVSYFLPLFIHLFVCLFIPQTSFMLSYPLILFSSFCFSILVSFFFFCPVLLSVFILLFVSSLCPFLLSFLSIGFRPSPPPSLPLTPHVTFVSSCPPAEVAPGRRLCLSLSGRPDNFPRSGTQLGPSQCPTGQTATMFCLWLLTVQQTLWNLDFYYFTLEQLEKLSNPWAQWVLTLDPGCLFTLSEFKDILQIKLVL